MGHRGRLVVSTPTDGPGGAKTVAGAANSSCVGGDREARRRRWTVLVMDPLPGWTQRETVCQPRRVLRSGGGKTVYKARGTRYYHLSCSFKLLPDRCPAQETVAIAPCTVLATHTGRHEGLIARELCAEALAHSPGPSTLTQALFTPGGHR